MLAAGGTLKTIENGAIMTPHAKWGIAGVIVGLILFIVAPWLAWTVIGLAIVIPTVAYLMLDSSQRRRLKEIRRRRQLGR
jgi:hypothetical protein